MSEPIQHSPGPWELTDYRYDVGEWIDRHWESVGYCKRIAGRAGKSIVEMNPYGTTGSDADLRLLTAASTMYHIIRQICHPDWRVREQGLRSAQFLLLELEGDQ